MSGMGHDMRTGPDSACISKGELVGVRVKCTCSLAGRGKVVIIFDYYKASAWLEAQRWPPIIAECFGRMIAFFNFFGVGSFRWFDGLMDRNTPRRMNDAIEHRITVG